MTREKTATCRMPTPEEVYAHRLKNMGKESGIEPPYMERYIRRVGFSDPGMELACQEPDYDVLAREAVEANPELVRAYRAGKLALGPLVGHVMKASRGAAKPSEVEATLRRILDTSPENNEP